MTKGQEIWTRNGAGDLARFKVTGTTEHGVNGIWLDGPLKGKEASVEKQTLSEITANAKRGATARRRDDEEEEDAFDRVVAAGDVALPDASEQDEDSSEAEMYVEEQDMAHALDTDPGPETLEDAVDETAPGGLQGAHAEAADPEPYPLDLDSEADAKKEAVRAAARERVRKWRAAKKAVQA